MRRSSDRKDAAPARKRPAASKPGKPGSSQTPIGHDADSVIASLKRLATKNTLDGMARYALPSVRAFGVSMADMNALAKKLGRDHELALALWKTGWYEARMVASMIDDPAQVTPAQMDRWCRDFNSWGICDTVCFKLFDQVPHAFKKVAQWSVKRDEFVKRAGFALLWSLALHDKRSGDEPFLKCLPLAEQGAADERNFVKKSIVMALGAVGRRSRGLDAAAKAVARRLAESANASERWVGKEALKKL